ncbi:Uncharacterised protein [Klebsiella pneumoniae]|nr:Uncharacterised protein [Klebsiella pneumoniae]
MPSRKTPPATVAKGLNTSAIRIITGPKLRRVFIGLRKNLRHKYVITPPTDTNSRLGTVSAAAAGLNPMPQTIGISRAI